ncbi:hypothetical protein Y887_10645 [Xanthomonas pisi DSM 18956]|nr:hypothetical protein Y887_10645 [Xanthomonas pisi DSM 18956]
MGASTDIRRLLAEQSNSSLVNADGQVISAGGRVLCVAALGDSVQDAQCTAYAGLQPIHWPSAFQRSDIEWRAISRERQAQA